MNAASISVRALAVVAALGAAAGACNRKDQTGLTLAGSTSVQPFAEKWGEAYRAAHPGVAIHVQGGGSTAGVQSALSGAAHIGTCSRELNGDEAKQLRSVIVARDGIALIVNPANTVVKLTPEQAVKIYSGEIINWKDVGGPDQKITVITREDGSGTRGAFEELLMKSAKIAPSALVQDSTGAVRQMVSGDPTAIGYISVGQVDKSVRALGLGDAMPTEADIDSGKYALVRPFLFVTRGEPNDMAREFIAWVTGPEGQALTRKEGLLPPK